MTQKMISPQESLRTLVKTRARMTLWISIAVILLLTINMLLMSSWTDIGAKPIFAGTSITIALGYSIFVIIAGALISGFYVWWANNVLDPLAEQARNELTPGAAK